SVSSRSRISLIASTVTIAGAGALLAPAQSKK
ncbi:unnamed protein product, partial [marine sediment metagenome]